MARVRLVHWKASEAAALLATLRTAGHVVDYDEDVASAEFRTIRTSPPEVFAIDLSRLPSHGREVATFFRGQKATRHIPIVFVGWRAGEGGSDPQGVAGCGVYRAGAPAIRIARGGGEAARQPRGPGANDGALCITERGAEAGDLRRDGGGADRSATELCERDWGTAGGRGVGGDGWQRMALPY
jgi:hypothetical protein